MFGFRTRTNLKVACVTANERGLVRKDNQDSFFVDPAKTVFCVADGMGGGSEGGTASRFVCEELEKAAAVAENDSQRRDVENQLYAQMLLPDMRSDILSLIEGCDKIINKYESDLILVSVERPQIPDALKPDLTHLIAVNINCVGTLVSGMKTVLGGTHVSDFVQEVYNLEHQVDLMAIDLKQKVFQELKLPLARQLQLKEFIYSIEKISDMAEDMADLLSLFVVKHAV